MEGVCHFNEPEENPTKYPGSSGPAQGLIIVKFKRLPRENCLKGKWETKERWEMREISEDKYAAIFDDYNLSITDAEDSNVDLSFHFTENTPSGNDG
jgi:hypothetical protein